MKITVDVELHEHEAQHASQVASLLSSIAETSVHTHVVTDKPALAALLRDAATSGRTDVIASELSRRLPRNELYGDCLDVLHTLLFDSQRFEYWNPSASSSSPSAPASSYLPSSGVACLLGVLARMSDAVKARVRDDIASTIVKNLVLSRPLDSCRDPLLPYCEVGAQLVTTGLLSLRASVAMTVQLLGDERTRCAGMTFLGKLVELNDEPLKRCDKSIMEPLRQALCSSQEDLFMYDIEYVSEALDWTSGSHGRMLALQRTCKPPSNPTGSGPSLAPVSSICFASPATVPSGSRNGAELVCVASLDGTIATYDASQGVPVVVSSIFLSRHMPVAIDFSPRGRFLVVAGAPKHAGTSPALHFYSNELQWNEVSSVEKDLRIISAVKWTRMPGHYISGEMQQNHDTYVRVTDAQRNVVVSEFPNHTDVVTTLYVAADRDNSAVSGSRDRQVLSYDLRSPNSPTTIGHLGSTVTCVHGDGEFVVAGSLDRKLSLFDIRMPLHVIAQREFESPVLSASLSHKGLCAVGVMTGLFTVNLNFPALPASKANASGSFRYHCVSWNPLQTHVLGGRDSGTVDIFLRSD